MHPAAATTMHVQCEVRDHMPQGLSSMGTVLDKTLVGCQLGLGILWYSLGPHHLGVTTKVNKKMVQFQGKVGKN